MTNEEIKNILLRLYPSDLDFSVIQENKKNKKFSASYNPNTSQITLYIENFESNKELIYNAIKEYTHHVIRGKYPYPQGYYGKRVDLRNETTCFWATFTDLLELAEKKSIYSIGTNNTVELQNFTTELKEDFIKKNGALIKLFGKKLKNAEELCKASDVIYEDYINRVLCIPLSFVRAAQKVSDLDLYPTMGFENMKLISSINDDFLRSHYEQMLTDYGMCPNAIKGELQVMELEEYLEKYRR